MHVLGTLGVGDESRARSGVFFLAVEVCFFIADHVGGDRRRGWRGRGCVEGREVVFVAFPAEGVGVVVHALDRCSTISTRFKDRGYGVLTLRVIEIAKGLDELRFLGWAFGFLGSNRLRVDGAQAGCC